MVRLILFTDRRQAARPLVDVVAAAVDGGARLVVLREKDLPGAERAALARRLHALLAPVDGRLLCAGRQSGPDGLHLAADDPLPPGAGRGAGAHGAGLIGRSCHDAAELARAADEGVDYVTLSPVFETVSKPGYGPALGPQVFARSAAPLPVYALGGVDTPERAYACTVAGAAGVAVMGAVMRADDPASVVAELLAAVTAVAAA